LSEKEQIEKLKQIALKLTNSATDFDARRNVLEAISAYGTDAIPTLIQLSESPSSPLREQALDWIAKIKTEAKEKAERRTYGP
jgi:HEAT repeat protein